MEKTKEDFIEFMRNTLNEIEKNDVNLSNAIIQTMKAVEDNLVYRTPLLEYGLKEMDMLMDDMKDKEFSSASEMGNYILEDAYKDGSLTLNTFKAEKELLANYTLEEIMEKSEDFNTKNPEILHIISVEEELINALEEKQEKLSSSINVNVKDKDLLLLSAYTLLNENGYDYDKQIKDLEKELEENSEIRIPKKTKQKEGNER